MPVTLTDREVDDEMASDWKAILDKHSAGGDEEIEEVAPKGGEHEEVEPEVEKGAKGEKAHEAAAADEDATDRPRDKSGRYKPLPKADKGAKGERAETPAARTAKDDTQAERAGQQPDAAQPRTHDVTRAPSTWTPKERAAWANVPQEARAAIHRREADFMAGQSQLLPDAKFGREMAATIEPYRMLIESEGGNPAAAVQDLLRTAAILRTGTIDQRYQVAANILNRFRLDPRLLVPRQPNGQAPTPIPPQQQFRDPRVDALLAERTQEAQQRAAIEQRDTETIVSRWLNETNREGQPLRPYAGDVIDDMAAIIPQLKAANPALTHAQALEAAYERATWGNPEIRALLQQEQGTAANPRARAESQRRAGEARRAASVNVPRRAGVPRRSPAGSMEDTIAETARDLGLIS